MINLGYIRHAWNRESHAIYHGKPVYGAPDPWKCLGLAIAGASTALVLSVCYVLLRAAL